jgi:aldose 1-epimerase
MNAVLLQSARASALLDAKAGGRLTSLIVEGQEVLAGVPRPPDAPDWYRGSFPLAPWAGTRGPARTRPPCTDWSPIVLGV